MALYAETIGLVSFAAGETPKPMSRGEGRDPPFGGKPGDKPALNDQEIDDVVAFLGTLTDGYKP